LPFFCYYIIEQKKSGPARHERIDALSFLSGPDRAAISVITKRGRIRMPNPLDDRKKALEEDYFRRREQEAIEKMRAQMASEQQAKEAAASAIKCPKCDGTLKELSFEEVQIDRCEKCGGVWLDAGELERLTKREEGGGGWLSRLWGSPSGE
jgi:uncharacterized protein with PIN domain